LSDLRDYIIYNLRKRWKKRAPIFATYVFSLSNLVQFISSSIEKILLFMLLTGVIIIIDEWIKEGYFFDPKDIGGLTHETLLLVFVPFLLPLGLYLKKKIDKLYSVNIEYYKRCGKLPEINRS